MQISTGKTNKAIALLRKFQNILLRPVLHTIYKSFVRTHLDYGDIIYNQAFNTYFHLNIESLEYNATLAIKGAIRGIMKGKKFWGVGFKPLQQRLWLKKICCFFKTKNPSLEYLFDIILQSNCHYRAGNENTIPHMKYQYFL